MLEGGEGLGSITTLLLLGSITTLMKSLMLLRLVQLCCLVAAAAEAVAYSPAHSASGLYVVSEVNY
jgi:hypothetical protein